MPEQPSERESLIESLPLGTDAQEWAALEDRILGRTEQCPPLVRLIELGRGLLTEAQASDLHTHARSCRYCGPWMEGFTRGAAHPRTGALEDFLAAADALGEEPESRQEVALPPPDPQAVAGDWELPIHSDTFNTAFRQASTPRQLLVELRQVLGDLLASVGLDTEMAGDFRDFALAQGESEWREATAWLPRMLERFAREKLGLRCLPVVLTREHWESAFTDCALRYLELNPPTTQVADKEGAQTFFRLVREQPEASAVYRGIREAGREGKPKVWPTLEEQRRLAREAKISEPEVRLLFAEACKRKRDIMARCIGSGSKKRTG